MQSEYYFREGCFITEWSNGPADPGCSIARARVEPGVTTRWHRLHNTTERYVILQGTGIADIENQDSRHLQTGDVLIIPPAHAQRITNTGSQDLIFMAVCTPRFVPENYSDTEQPPA